MMADAVAGMVAGGEIPAGTPQSARYPLFRWPVGEALQAHLALAQGGLPRTLFERWRPLCSDPERLTLPAGEVEPPLPLELRPLTR
jgi:hypothetical protein